MAAIGIVEGYGNPSAVLEEPPWGGVTPLPFVIEAPC